MIVYEVQLLKQQNTSIQPRPFKEKKKRRRKKETLLHEHQAVYGSGSLTRFGHTLLYIVRKVTIYSVL